MVPGAVLATGGIVAKLVGVTFTTVVATPNVSPPHADMNVPASVTQATAATARPIDVRERNVNTTSNSRAWSGSTGGARDVFRQADVPLAQLVMAEQFHP